VAVALLLLLVVVVVQKVLHHGISSGMATGSFVLLFAVNSSHHFLTVIHIIDILKPVILSATYFSTGPSFFGYAMFEFWKFEKETWHICHSSSPSLRPQDSSCGHQFFWLS